MSYQVKRSAYPQSLEVRGLRFQLYCWPGEDPRPIVMIHGWGDSGATYQFVLDNLSTQRTVVAYDARGFGRTQWPQQGYWFLDYLADLDAILDSLSPHDPVDIVGHSMGGNVAMLYAGVRPHRVRRLINLEGFGLPHSQPDQAPGRYREWLDEIKSGQEFATYDSFEQFAAVLARRNPHTPSPRLDFVARWWGRERDDGRIELRADPRHKLVNPIPYQRDQALACWKLIAAPTQLVVGERSEFAKRTREQATEEQWRVLAGGRDPVILVNAGHMLHHEQPEAVAELIQDFLR